MKIVEYEKQKKAPKQFICDNCQYEWYSDETKVNSAKVKNEKKQEMLVQFFLCPKCNKIYIVSIIDSKVRTYLSKLAKVEKRYQRRHETEDYEQYQVLRQQLMKYEDGLKAKYGKYFYLNHEEVNH